MVSLKKDLRISVKKTMTEIVRVPHYWIEKGLQGTVVNQAILSISYLVPLKKISTA